MSSYVPVRCPHCSHGYLVREDKIGLRKTCTQCQKQFIRKAMSEPDAETPQSDMLAELKRSASEFAAQFESTPPAIVNETEPGLLETYMVVYRGGHPDYPWEKATAITFKMFEDRFELLPTVGSRGWFKGLNIEFAAINSLEIVERQISTIEGIFGGINSRQLNQRNNIHISYKPEAEREVLLRLEMLSGFTVMGQAKKCQQFLDRLRTHGIFEKFRKKPKVAMPRAERVDDIPTQIEKLAILRDKKIITEEEFSKKKTELLAKM